MLRHVFLILGLLVGGCTLPSCASIPTKTAGTNAIHDIKANVQTIHRDLAEAKKDTGIAGRAHIDDADASANVIDKDADVADKSLNDMTTDRDKWMKLAKEIMSWWWPYWIHQLAWYMLIIAGLVALAALAFWLANGPLFFKVAELVWHVCTAGLFKLIGKGKASLIAWFDERRAAMARSEAATAEIAQHVEAMRATQLQTAPLIIATHAATIASSSRTPGTP